MLAHVSILTQRYEASLRWRSAKHFKETIRNTECIQNCLNNQEWQCTCRQIRVARKQLEWQLFEYIAYKSCVLGFSLCSQCTFRTNASIMYSIRGLFAFFVTLLYYLHLKRLLQRNVCVGLSICPSVRLSVGLLTFFLSGCADVLFWDADLERFFDLPRLYTCTVLLYCTAVLLYSSTCIRIQVG